MIQRYQMLCLAISAVLAFVMMPGNAHAACAEWVVCPMIVKSKIRRTLSLNEHADSVHSLGYEYKWFETSKHNDEPAGVACLMGSTPVPNSLKLVWLAARCSAESDPTITALISSPPPRFELRNIGGLLFVEVGTISYNSAHILRVIDDPLTNGVFGP